MSEQRQGRRMLLLLVGIFVLPVVVGMVLYLSGWRPSGKGHGELLNPPRALHLQPVLTAQGKPFGLSSWRDKWHLVIVTAGACEVECLNNLRDMRQIHASLGKEIGRMERVWVQTGKLPAKNVDAVQQAYLDLVILPNAAALARQFDTISGGRGIYLVDPLGNLLIWYPQGSQPDGIRKDLMRLLTYSWTG